MTEKLDPQLDQVEINKTSPIRFKNGDLYSYIKSNFCTYLEYRFKTLGRFNYWYGIKTRKKEYYQLKQEWVKKKFNFFITFKFNNFSSVGYIETQCIKVNLHLCFLNIFKHFLISLIEDIPVEINVCFFLT